MRRAALATVVALVACNEPTRHYTGLSDGQGGGDGQRAGDARLHDAAPDGFVGPPPMTKAYLLDTQGGQVIPLRKDATTGALAQSGVSPIPLTAPKAAAIDRAGTHLYVLQDTGPMTDISDFAINSDGSLAGPTVRLASPCSSPWFAAVDPSGSWLAIGCVSANFVIFPISSTGALGNPDVRSAGTNPMNPAFTPDGKCLYIVDLNGLAGIHVLAFQFDVTTGATTAVPGAAGPATPRAIAIHPSNGVVYVAGQSLTAYTYDPTSCALTESTAITGTIGPNTMYAAITPDRNHLLVTGTEVYSFAIGAGGALTAAPGNPFLATGTTMDSAIVDPGMPDTLYITGRGYMGSLQATVASNGAVTQTSAITVANTNPQWLQLAP